MQWQHVPRPSQITKNKRIVSFGRLRHVHVIGQDFPWKTSIQHLIEPGHHCTDPCCNEVGIHPTPLLKSEVKALCHDDWHNYQSRMIDVKMDQEWQIVSHGQLGCENRVKSPYGSQKRSKKIKRTIAAEAIDCHQPDVDSTKV